MLRLLAFLLATRAFGAPIGRVWLTHAPHDPSKNVINWETEKSGNYKDPQSKFFASQDNYLLLTLTLGATSMKAQFKNLLGEVLDTREIAKRP